MNNQHLCRNFKPSEIMQLLHNRALQVVLIKITKMFLDKLTTSISVLEWPMLQTMQPFFNLSRCSLVTTFLFPVINDCID